ncbi:major capsid protein [Succinatimonas hippei]|uniref:major capsid protein n=1 Tax=Succinatimonas hippei TaxID=626938 RepID=UPI002492484C|nr:major capsid protein [Succinatimonas hippei]
MAHQFSRVPSVSIQRSTFDRSHGYKTTFNEGYLVPFFVDEVLPGDTFNLNTTLFSRLSTPVVPFMDNLFLETFFFYVPDRLVWDNFQKMMGEQENPGDSTDYLIPQITVTNAENQSIFDYFGIPTRISNGIKVNALPFRAYNLIWNEWFRDENLQDSVTVAKGDSGDPTYTLLKRGKRHDYFTSALPWPQKGDAIDVPLSAQIEANFTNPLSVTLSPFNPVVSSAGSSIPKNTLAYLQQSALNDVIFTGSMTSPAGGYNKIQFSGSGSVSASELNKLADGLSIGNATGSIITINELRQAFQVQRMLEKDARGGTRYTEILRAHFGVVSPDARLQRPEFLGGSSSRININPVQQTSGTTDTSPQGNLAAYGVVADRYHGFTKSFVEHGFIIGLINVRADITYQQGLNRLWKRRTRLDHFWPTLAHLGEQTVTNDEIYAQGTAADDDAFGYQERYAEYRYKPSLITGKFRSNDPQSLDVWHLSQYFQNLPVLNDEFIEDAPPINRVVAVQDEPHFLLDVYFNLKCTRPMPLYSVPGLIDHF